MIEVYFWPTPNGHKITIFLEEAGVDYRVVPVNIAKGDQFKPDFLKIAPNNRMPAIIDYAPIDGGEPVSVFESGAILLYLAEKTGKFMPSDIRGRMKTIEWLFWQVGGLGPIAGQTHHFNAYIDEKIPYAISRFVNETNRLYGVLDRQLEGKDFITGEYSIADMAAYPWTVSYERQAQKLEDFPNVRRWHEAMKARAAVMTSYKKGEAYRSPDYKMSEEDKKVLYGQTAASVKAASRLE
jgi:GSH-dependent disulfide-bond oxidoreductase